VLKLIERHEETAKFTAFHFGARLAVGA
jgi:hypothetical protein